MTKLVELNNKETLALRYLCKSAAPLWGGHLKRGEPPHPHMRRWLDLGLIEPVEDRGYRATPICRASLRWPKP